MKRIALAALAALGLALLNGCDKEPERPVTPPPPISQPAPVPAPTPAAVVEPEAVPVPESRPELVAPKPRPVRKPRVAKPVEPPVPAGFVRMASGDVTGADGQAHRTGSYAIAREPVTVGQLREWASSEGGRRLPQLGNADTAVATDLDWLAAEAYARWLGEKEKRAYRLPTEIEWVRAARSGRILTQAQREPSEPPLWEWTGDCWDSESNGHCLSRVLVGGENATSGAGDWGRAAMGARRPAASFRLVLDLK